MELLIARRLVWRIYTCYFIVLYMHATNVEQGMISTRLRSRSDYIPKMFDHSFHYPSSCVKGNRVKKLYDDLMLMEGHFKNPNRTKFKSFRAVSVVKGFLDDLWCVLVGCCSKTG